MGISVQEFKTAMETLNARRIEDCEGEEKHYMVPCFKVKDVIFLHSGSYYVVQQGNKVDQTIMKRAMAELGECYPGRDNFWHDDIYSIRCLLTLCVLIEKRYSKKLVNRLINETYKKLLKLIQKDIKKPFFELPSEKLEELRREVTTYDLIVNPFDNSNIELKEPINYWDKMQVKIAIINQSAQISMMDANVKLIFYNKPEEIGYQSIGWHNEKKGKKITRIMICHYYCSGDDGKSVDEIIHLSRKRGNGNEKFPSDIELKISMKTGLAWQTNTGDQAIPVTDEQIAIMMTHLRKNIKKAKLITNEVIN